MLGCCAVGLGSGLSLVGAPASAVLLSPLSGAAYATDGKFLFALAGAWLVPGIAGLAGAAAVLAGRSDPAAKALPEDPFSLWNLLVLTARLFAFTAGLVLLSAALTPLIERLFLGLHPAALYWANALAAVADDAAVIAVQVSPAMSQDQLRHAFPGVLTSVGAFLAGDAPNLVAAQRLDAPASAALMVFCFLSLADLRTARYHISSAAGSALGGVANTEAAEK